MSFDAVADVGQGGLDALLGELEAGAALAAQVETARATLAAARAAVTAAESELADAQQQATAAAANINVPPRITGLRPRLSAIGP